MNPDHPRTEEIFAAALEITEQPPLAVHKAGPDPLLVAITAEP